MRRGVRARFDTIGLFATLLAIYAVVASGMPLNHLIFIIGFALVFVLVENLRASESDYLQNMERTREDLPCPTNKLAEKPGFPLIPLSSLSYFFKKQKLVLENLCKFLESITSTLKFKPKPHLVL